MDLASQCPAGNSSANRPASSGCRHAALPHQGTWMSGDSRGFALLATLWVLAALTVLTGVGIQVARVGSLATRNRVLLARAEWAREACGEILLARYARDGKATDVDPVDLGRGTWCRATIEDPAGKFNVNTADGGALVTLLSAIGYRRSADSIIAARGRGTIYDLQQVPGIDSGVAARLAW